MRNRKTAWQVRVDAREPGARPLAPEPGVRFFHPVSDARLRVVCAGVAVLANGGGRTALPPLPAAPPPAAPGVRGDDPPGSLPTLTVS